MRYKTKITVSVVMLAASVVAMGMILYWGADRAQYNLERAHHAHEEYAAYLSLSAETFRLFKQIRRDLMDGEGETQLDVNLAKIRLQRELERIDAEIQAEFALGLRDGEKDEETLRLASLTEQIGLALDEVTEVERLLSIGERERAVALLSSTLEQRIDGQVSAIIESGLADEREEVNEANAVTDALTGRLRTTASIAIVGATSFAVLSIWLLLAQLRKPLRELEEGTKRLAEGALDYRIEVVGTDEFAALADHFNAMAGQLSHQRQALDDARRNLERQVAERTLELRHANEQLSQRDELRSQFFADISHELRTPITAMRGVAEVAIRTKQDHQSVYVSALKRVVDLSGQLTRLVNDLFLVARSDAGALDLRRMPLDVETVVMTVVEDMQPLYADEGATLQVETTNRSMIVAGDRERLRQVFSILVDNALKHGPKGVETRIKLKLQDKRAIVEVIDNGPGIDARQVNKIFDRFYRGNRGSGPSDGCSGLGLPIAKSLVEAHGGDIEIESAAGAGAAFTVSLPLVPAASLAGKDLSDEREAV